MTAVPELVERHEGAVRSAALDRLRDDRVAAARAREARGLGEGAELDGNVLGTRDLIDGARHIVFRDVGGISGVEEDDRLIFLGVVDPLRQLLARERRARRVVRAAEVDHVDLFLRQVRCEVVLRRAGQIDDAFEVAVVLQRSRAAGHDVRVEVDRVNRVRDGDLVGRAEDLLDVAAVALRAVADENLIRRDLDAAVRVVVLDDGFRQEGVALLRAVAVERLSLGLIVDGLVHGLDADLRQRLRDIADAETDDVGIRVCFFISSNAACDFSKEVAAWQLQIVIINSSHKMKSSS